MSAQEQSLQTPGAMRPVESARAAPVRRGRPLLDRIVPYLFIGPHLLFFLAFMVVPTVFGLYISFFNWDFLGSARFVGFKNYLNLFDKSMIQGTYFWPAVWATVEFVLYSVPLLLLIPLLLALALNTRLRGRVVFRTVFFAPVILSVATVAIIWRWMLDTNAGLVNYFAKAWFGIDRLTPWLVEQPWAWISLVIMTVWWTIGSNMVLFLAGLQEIPEHLYEAASIDGARGFHCFWHITLPLLKPTTLFVTVMTTIASFNVFGQPYMTTGGGPGTSTRVAIMLIRNEAFKDFRMGSASAMAWVLGLIMIVISLVQFRLMKDQVEY